MPTDTIRKEGERMQLEPPQNDRPDLILPNGAKPRKAFEYWNLGRSYGDFCHDYENMKPPLPTFIKPIDDALHGGLRPGVHVLGAASGSGKTAFSLLLATKIGAREKPNGEHYGVTFISEELTSWEVRARMGSRLSRTDGNLEPYEWGDFERLAANAAREREEGTYDFSKDRVILADLRLQELCPKLRIVDGARNLTTDDENRRTSAVDLSSLNYIEMELDTAGRCGADLVIIDYLQCLDAGQNEGTNEAQALKTILRSINRIGMKYNLPILCIAALNRVKANEIKKGGEPTMDAFRDSSWIEYTALSAWIMGPDPQASEVDDRYKHLRLTPVKIRAGEHGTDHAIDLIFEGAYGQFYWTEMNLEKDGINGSIEVQAG